MGKVISSLAAHAKDEPNVHRKRGIIQMEAIQALTGVRHVQPLVEIQSELKQKGIVLSISEIKQRLSDNRKALRAGKTLTQAVAPVVKQPEAFVASIEPQVPGWNEPSQSKPEYSNPWAAFDLFREKYRQPKIMLNPNTVHDQAKGKDKIRRDPTRPDASVPYYAQRAMVELNNFVCPVLGLKEGESVQIKGRLRIIKMVTDHIIPEVDGGLTTPENIRMVSMIANELKNRFKLSDEQVRARYAESGYTRYEIPVEHLAVFQMYNASGWVPA